MTRRAHRSTRTDPLFPYTTLFRSGRVTGFYGSMANGSNMLDFIHPEDHVAALDAFDRGVLRGDPVDPLVLCIRMADDEWHHMERSEEHTSELQSLMRISYAVFCLKKKKNNVTNHYYSSSR